MINHRVRRVHAVALTFLVSLSAGCESSSTSHGRKLDEPNRVGTVSVTRQTITSVVTLDANVVPTPVFVLSAIATGVTRRASFPHSELPSGTPIFTEAGHTVRIPVGATFLRWLVSPDEVVPAGLPVAEFRYNGFGLAASIPATLAYRVYSTPTVGRAEIVGGPGPFDCNVLSLVGAPQGSSGAGQSQAQVLCAAPKSVRLYIGVQALLALRTARRRNVLSLPVQSVDGRADRGSVTLVDGKGGQRQRSVGLGVTDGNYIEITSGLRAGDRVLSVNSALSGG